MVEHYRGVSHIKMLVILLFLALYQIVMLEHSNHPKMFGKLTRQERRAITPKGFAEAFFRANL